MMSVQFSHEPSSLKIVLNLLTICSKGNPATSQISTTGDSYTQGGPAQMEGDEEGKIGNKHVHLAYYAF